MRQRPAGRRAAEAAVASGPHRCVRDRAGPCHGGRFATSSARLSRPRCVGERKVGMAGAQSRRQPRFWTTKRGEPTWRPPALVGAAGTKPTRTPVRRAPSADSRPEWERRHAARTGAGTLWGEEWIGKKKKPGAASARGNPGSPFQWLLSPRGEVRTGFSMPPGTSGSGRGHEREGRGGAIGRMK